MTEAPTRQRHLYVPSSSVGKYFAPEDDLSMADRLSMLTLDEQEEILDDLDMDQLQYDPDFWMRPSQLEAINSQQWMTVCLAGRGWGKTRVLSEAIHKYAMENPGARLALVGRTTSDVRDVLIMGDSGILSVTDPKGRPDYKPNIRRVVWPNGAEAMTFCVDEETEAYTRRGWMRHDQLRDDDEVYTIDPASQTGVWSPVKKLNKFHVVDEEMLSCEGQSHSSLTTMNHRWLVHSDNKSDTVEWLTSRDLAYGYGPGASAGNRPQNHWRKKIPKQRLILSAQHQDIPTEPTYDDALVELMGWFISEGYTPDNARKRRSIVIRQSLSVNPTKHARIVSALTRFFGAPREKLTRSDCRPQLNDRTWYWSGDRFFIDPVAASELLTHLNEVDYSSREKALKHEFIYSLTAHQLQLFLDAFIDGDGHRRADGWGIGQRFKAMRDDLELVCILLGTQVHTSDHVAEYKGEPYPWHSMVHHMKPHRGFQGRSIKKYTGTVWCPTTTTGTWLARRRGKIYFTGNSAERPDGIRGAQFHAAFCDEIGSYRSNTGSSLMNAFDQIKVATRLGDEPRIFVATTPRRIPSIIDLVEQADTRPDQVLLIRGSTLANRHLSAAYKDVITGMYDGTALGRQEIEGELLSDVEGSLLNQSTIDESRRDDLDPSFFKTLPYRVVGVDPSVSAKPNDECGIVVCGSTSERKLYKRDSYVIEDASLLGPPAVWAKEVVRVARKYRAVVVAEDNQGGEMVRMIIQEQDPQVPVTLVRSKVSKKDRAEPVGLAYERGRVHHMDWFGLLESQLTTWSPDEDMGSPDRLDALTHAVTALAITPPKHWVGGVRSHNPGEGRNLPVNEHDPLQSARSGNINGRNIDSLRRRLGQIDGVDEKDTRRFEDEPSGDSGSRQKQLRQTRRMTNGAPSKAMNGTRRGGYATPVKTRYR